MPRYGSGLTAELIHELNTKENLTLTEIGARYGISPQAVSKIKSKGKLKTPREVAMENFPWPGMDPKFKRSVPYQRITDHLEYVVTGGTGMSKAKLTELRRWYKQFGKYNHVLVYDPTIPPRQGMQSGGWGLEPRVESDADLLIRENEYTTLSDAGREIWRIPDRFPEI
ncbi:XRE family transcriptional regulator [Pseudonocardiaceae bacterium YIM PH 21723]|nr:XRE family transcriptional regulator [Pseudonocardiaceae bacterium YIM PH 21723]